MCSVGCQAMFNTRCGVSRGSDGGWFVVGAGIVTRNWSFQGNNTKSIWVECLPSSKLLQVLVVHEYYLGWSLALSSKLLHEYTTVHVLS